MLIQGDLKNLRPMQCYIREDPNAQKPEEVCEHNQGNPFLAGGPVSQDGDKIVELWKLGRLGQYCKEGDFTIKDMNSHQNLEEENAKDIHAVTLEHRKDTFKSLCCFIA